MKRQFLQGRVFTKKFPRGLLTINIMEGVTFDRILIIKFLPYCLEDYIFFLSKNALNPESFYIRLSRTCPSDTSKIMLEHEYQFLQKLVDQDILIPYCLLWSTPSNYSNIRLPLRFPFHLQTSQVV